MNWKSLAAAAALCLVATGLAAQPPVLIFPQVASGSGIDIEILLSNPATTENRGTLSFRDQTGNPLSLRIDGSLEDSVSFSIPAGGLLKITTEGDGELRSGYATVHSEAPESKLAGTLVFNLKGMEVSVPGAAPGGRAHITAEIDEDVDTAVALANPGDDPIDVILRLIDESGDLVEEKVVDLEPGQRDALFVSEIFSNAGEFSRGTVHAVSAQHFGMLGLRQRQSGSLVAMGSSPEVLGAILQPFGSVTVDPGFDLNGIGKNIDSPGFWEGPDPEKTLLFVSAKSNELVEVWEFPFVDNELPALESGFGEGRVNGVAIDEQTSLLYVSQGQPTSSVYVYSLPDLSFVREFDFPEEVETLGNEPNLTIFRDRESGETLVYVTADEIVYVFRASTGQMTDSFRPEGPGSFETIVADNFYQRFYIPDENDQRGIYVYEPSGEPHLRCIGSKECTNNFGSETFQDDGEGILLYTCPSSGSVDDGTGFVVVSDQRNSRTDFEFFDRADWRHLGTLRINGVNNTDGVASTQRAMPGYPAGLFIAVDNDKTTVGVGWDVIFDATGLSCN